MRDMVTKSVLGNAIVRTPMVVLLKYLGRCCRSIQIQTYLMQWIVVIHGDL